MDNSTYVKWYVLDFGPKISLFLLRWSLIVVCTVPLPIEQRFRLVCDNFLTSFWQLYDGQPLQLANQNATVGGGVVRARIAFRKLSTCITIIDRSHINKNITSLLRPKPCKSCFQLKRLAHWGHFVRLKHVLFPFLQVLKSMDIWWHHR